MKSRLVLILVLLSSPLLGQIRDVPLDMKVRIPILLSVTLNPASVQGGAVAGGTVTLVEAPQSAVTVNLLSSRPSVAAVPPSVPVQPGSRTATFVIQSYSVAPGDVVISASIGSAARKTATLTVLPPPLQSVTVTPDIVGGGSTATVKVKINGVAPSGGLNVDLSTALDGGADPSTATVTPKILIPAGAASATGQLMTRTVTQPVSGRVIGSLGGVSKTDSFGVVPLQIVGVTGDPDFKVGGTMVVYTISLNAPAPPEGFGYQVSVTDGPGSGGCGPMPSMGPTKSGAQSMKILAGAKSGTFKVRTYPGGGHWYINLGGPSSFSIWVQPPVLRANALKIPASVKGGQTVQATLRTDGVAAPANCDNTYQLNSSNPLYAQVPAAVTISPGGNMATFPITTSAVTAAQSVTIKVSGFTGDTNAYQTAMLTIVP